MGIIMVLVVMMVLMVLVVMIYKECAFDDHSTLNDNDILSKPSFNIHHEIFEGVDFEGVDFESLN